jgi:hypothetical protein
MPGTACTTEAAACVTTGTLGLCDKATATWFEQRCKAGCADTRCEYVFSLGDPCPGDFEGAAACERSSAMMTCVAGKWTHSSQACPKCATGMTGVTCF